MTVGWLPQSGQVCRDGGRWEGRGHVFPCHPGGTSGPGGSCPGQRGRSVLHLLATRLVVTRTGQPLWAGGCEHSSMGSPVLRGHWGSAPTSGGWEQVAAPGPSQGTFLIIPRAQNRSRPELGLSQDVSLRPHCFFTAALKAVGPGGFAFAALFVGPARCRPGGGRRPGQPHWLPAQPAAERRPPARGSDISPLLLGSRLPGARGPESSGSLGRASLRLRPANVHRPGRQRAPWSGSRTAGQRRFSAPEFL